MRRSSATIFEPYQADVARATFFARVGAAGRLDDRQRDDYTLPLFPLWLILDADGTLAQELRPLVDRTQD
jgi:hypothetical protein